MVYNEAILMVRMHKPELMVVNNGRVVGSNWSDTIRQYYNFYDQRIQSLQLQCFPHIVDPGNSL